MATVTTLPTLRLALVDLKDQGSICISDISTYLTIPSPSAVSLQIQAPGWPMLNVPFQPGSLNVYKCGDLGILCEIVNCCPLPDGIYSVTYTTSTIPPATTSIVKTFIKIDQIECRFQNAFLKVDLECDCEYEEKKKYKEMLREIDLLINGSVAAANDCNDLLSVKLYQQADALIDRIYSKLCLYCGPIESCHECN